MRILVLPVGSHGDVHPLLGIALRLRGRGHEVAVGTNEHFEGLVRGVGLPFLSTGTDAEFREALAEPDLWHPLRGFRVVMERGVLPVMRRTYELIRAHYPEPEGVVIVAAGIAFGARMAQDRHGYHVATVQLQPAVFRSVYENPKLPGMWMPGGMPRWMKGLMWGFADWAVVDRVLVGPINEYRRELGLGALRGGILKDWWNSPERVIGLWPGWFAPVQPDWPGQVRLTGFPLWDERGVEGLSGELEEFLEGGERPVAFTPGSANVHGREFFEASVEACRQIGRRAILLTRHGGQVPGGLSGDVMHVGYAPFSELLPRCAALVHHGGIGTTAQALAAGCRQVVMPLSHDQPDNGKRVERLGVGRVISPGRYEGRGVGRVLEEIIGSGEVGGRCAEVAGRFEGVDAIGRACEEIEGVGGQSMSAGG